MAVTGPLPALVLSGCLHLSATHVAKTIDFGINTKLCKVAFSSFLGWITFNFILIAYVRSRLSTKEEKCGISVCAYPLKKERKENGGFVSTRGRNEENT